MGEGGSLPKKALLTTLSLAAVLRGDLLLSAACPESSSPAGRGFPEGQSAAAILGPSTRVAPPKRHVAVPQGALDTVRISLTREECLGSCPVYAVEVRGDGSATYDGKAYVLVPGRHESKVSEDDVRCLLEQFRKADFWSLASNYSAEITDGPLYRLTLSIGGQTKTVTDYFGPSVGMPVALTAIEAEIDRLAANRWVRGDASTLASLRAEHFDFRSGAAATILARATARAPDDLVFGLIEAGAPTTGTLGRGWRAGFTAVESASGAGRAGVVRALIAKGAFSDAPPMVKGAALIAGAASGNPDIVAAILEHGPDVNAQDAEGRTALIAMWRARRYGVSHPDIPGVARRLLAAGADPNRADKFGATALFAASSAEVVRMLLKAGAKLEVRDRFGATPLIQADSDEAAVALIEAGADTHVTSQLGYTIESHATARKFAATLRLLRSFKTRRQPPSR